MCLSSDLQYRSPRTPEPTLTTAIITTIKEAEYISDCLLSELREENVF